MDFFGWYLKVLKNYVTFDGRARRKEFWMFALVNFIVAFVLGIIAAFIKLPILSSLYSLAVLLPSIAVGARRLHDIGKSGWMQLVALIPLVGIIWLIILWVKEGNSGDNEYGSDPKTFDLD